MTLKARTDKVQTEAAKQLAYLNLRRHQAGVPTFRSETEMQAFYMGFLAGALAKTHDAL